MATKTVGAGGDYATLTLWAAYVNALTLSAPEVCNILSGGLVDDTGVTVNIGGWSGGSPTNTVTIKAATGQGFKDDSGAATNPLRFDASKGAALLAGDTYIPSFQFTGSNIVVDGLQFKGPGSTEKVIYVTGSNVTIKNCVVEGTTNWPTSVISSTGTSGVLLENLSVIQKGAGRGVNIIGDGNTVLGCTIVTSNGSGDLAIIAEYGTASVVKNCAAFGWVADYYGTVDASSTNNATDKSSFGGTNYGTNGQVSAVVGTEIESIVSGSEDLRLKSTSVKLKNHGATAGLSTDILGRARVGTYDIGAWEDQAAGGPTLIEPGYATVTMTGYAPTVTQVAGAGTLTSPLPMANNTPTVQTGLSSLIAIVATAAGVYVTTKTGVTTNGTGYVVISDPLFTPSSNYKVWLLNATTNGPMGAFHATAT